MAHLPLPSDEQARLSALRQYGILDTEAEARFDELVQLASQICEVPISLISLIDTDRQWFKANVGLAVPETPRDQAFCVYAIEKTELMEVPDAWQDGRFADNPLVTGDPNIRFYAGMPLITPSGLRLGTLCVIDRKPRKLTPPQRTALEVLSRQVMAQMELSLKIKEQQQALQAAAQAQQALRQALRELADTQATMLQQRKMDALRRLTAGMAHELNNPAHYISGGAVLVEEKLQELLRDVEARVALLEPHLAAAGLPALQELKAMLAHHPALEELQGLLPELKAGGEKVASIVRKLRSFARIDEKDCKEEAITNSLEAAIDMMLPHLAPRIEVRRQYALGDGTLECCPKLLGQIWMELLHNAMMAIPDQGQINIEVEDGAACVEVKISDNGVGMSDEELEQACDPFYSSRPVGQGIGMGLAVVHSLVAQHGGRLRIESQKGAGTAVAVCLPKSLAEGLKARS
jgi:signal transduction histidine kinase